MEYTDRVLKCIDCGAEFIFTAGEQVFFYDKQFKNDPKHCKQCKAKRARGGSRVRPETRTTCSECGAETTVPFKPTQGRPVLCRSCFQKQPLKAPASAPRPAARTYARHLAEEQVARGTPQGIPRRAPAWPVAPNASGCETASEPRFCAARDARLSGGSQSNSSV